MIKSIERSDLLRFYDHYVSPSSIHRRKLAVHVNPSPLVLHASHDQKGDENKDELVAATDEDLPEPLSDGNVETTAPAAAHEPLKLTEQPPIVDTLTNKEPKEGVTPKKELDLPQVSFPCRSPALHPCRRMFSRRNGLTMFTSGKVNCRVTRSRNPTRKSIYPFSVNYKENFLLRTSSFYLSFNIVLCH